MPHQRRSLNISDSAAHPPLFVAPMVGLTHVALRELLQEYCPPGFTIFKHTEMISTRRLPSEKLEGPESLRTAKGEKNLIPQLLGNEKHFIEASIKKLEAWEPIAYDINMGCPVKHTLKHNWGVRLMGDVEYAKRVVDYAKKSTSRPVSVKLRASAQDEQSEEALICFVRGLQDAGANWITLHARSAEARHSGVADWSIVKKLRKQLHIPVIVNGDIQTWQDVCHLLEESDIDGVMLGRIATARPWVIWQCAHKLGFKSPPPAAQSELHQDPPWTPEEERNEYLRCCSRMLQLLQKHYEREDFVVERFRFFIATGCRWFPFGHHFWKLSTKAKSIVELHDMIRPESLGADGMLQRIRM